MIISTNASNNTIGGQTADLGNKIAFNAQAGVSVQSGTGDSILSNSIFANGHLGIDLVAPAILPAASHPIPFRPILQSERPQQSPGVPGPLRRHHQRDR